MLSRHLTTRREAILDGLEFIYRSASDPENFSAYGFDYLFSFLISSKSRDLTVSQHSTRMGKKFSLTWVENHQIVPLDVDADSITELVFGSLSTEQFGVHASLKSEIRKAARRFKPYDYFWFDPAVEPPPRDVPDDCNCGTSNNRGAKVCKRCRRTLSMMSRYEVWVVALIRSYLGERYGVTLGARYSDVLKWLPHMRPYPECEESSNSDFVWSIYAITHIAYTLNDYNSYRLDPRWLPCEFMTLKNSLDDFIRMADPETVGEILDCLKSFGVSSESTLVQKGIAYLLSCQNLDGSWGEPDVEDIYERCHVTIAAINGLDEYAWRGMRVSFPEIEPRLFQWGSI